jgi:valyl-tRNA synthetase
LELAKVSLQSENEALQRGTRKTLLNVLETVLRLSHPIMPFITEEIWQRVAPLLGIVGDTVMLQAYPIANAAQINSAAIAEIDWMMNCIVGVRRIREEINIDKKKQLQIFLKNGSENDANYVSNNLVYLQKLARLESMAWLATDEVAPESAIALVGEMQILIPMAGLIDKAAELARLDKEILRIKNDLPRVEGKLNNPAFVDKAPEEVLNKERVKLADMQASLSNLEQQRVKISSL